MKEQFDKKGHLVVKNFLSENEKNIITDIFFDTLEKYNYKKYNNRNFKDIQLHKDLLKFRKEQPKRFGDFFDELPLNANLKSIIHKKKFINLSSKILGVHKNSIFFNGYKIRLDAPKDKRNNLIGIKIVHIFSRLSQL